MPSPALNTAGPKWSKKMNGPTMRERPDGSARCTWKPPRSTVRGTITCSTASLDGASPRLGSLPGKKLMTLSDDGQRTTEDGKEIPFVHDICRPSSVLRPLFQSIAYGQATGSASH